MRTNSINNELTMVKIEELNELLTLNIYEKSYVFNIIRLILNAIKTKQSEDYIPIYEIALTKSEKIIYEMIENYNKIYITKREIEYALTIAILKGEYEIAEKINSIPEGFEGSKEKLIEFLDEDIVNYIIENSHKLCEKDEYVLLYKNGRIEDKYL